MNANIQLIPLNVDYFVIRKPVDEEQAKHAFALRFHVAVEDVQAIDCGNEVWFGPVPKTNEIGF